MKTKWTQITLANNLKFFRKELDLTQKDIAKISKISYRLIQDLESGSANPTLDTLNKLAITFKITVKDLLSLSRIRLLEGDLDFIENFMNASKNAKIALGIRNQSGTAIYGNKSLEKIHGSYDFSHGPIDLLSAYSTEVKGLLKNQMMTEKNGYAFPYTIAHLNVARKETIFLRCYPTLILPYKGSSPVYTSVYISEIIDDCTLNYYDYCKLLFTIVYKN